MNALQKSWYVLRYLGPRFVLVRLRLAAWARLGALRRVFAPQPWDQIDLGAILRPDVPREPQDYARWRADHVPTFLFPSARPPAAVRALPGGERRPKLDERLALLEQGRCVYFYDVVPDEPVAWNRNPLTGGVATMDRPWYELSDFDPQQGDIRTLWEPARFAWAFDLARAAARGYDLAPLRRLFERWLDSWMDACPPFLGVHFKCGQEAAVRMIGVSFAARALYPPGAMPTELAVRLLKLAWATGYRIAHHIDYAISQKNNHAISEACGLLLVGQLFPELRDAARWWRRGREVLERELLRQIYDDGSYVQHSLNYQRVALHGAVLAMRLAEIAGRPLPGSVYERVGRSGEFLRQLADAATGRLPHYGNDDGAYVLPLTECHRLDVRPLVQSLYYLQHRRRALTAGPWDEALLWLFGDEAALTPVDPPPGVRSQAFEAGGYYTLRGPESWAMIRCHRYRDRPAQRDNLHVDLWWHGCNVLCDAGTYQYFVPDNPALAEYFRSPAAHNVVQPADTEPITHLSRFTWFPWPDARKLKFEPRQTTAAGPVGLFEGVVLDYEKTPRPVRWRRCLLRLTPQCWLVIDDLLGRGRGSATVFWHVADGPVELRDQSVRIQLPPGHASLHLAAPGSELSRVRLVRADPGAAHSLTRPQGLAAPNYSRLAPRPAIEWRLSATLPIRCLTLILLGCEGQLDALDPTGCRWRITAAGRRGRLQLAPPDRQGRGVVIDWRTEPED